MLPTLYRVAIGCVLLLALRSVAMVGLEPTRPAYSMQYVYQFHHKAMLVEVIYILPMRLPKYFNLETLSTAVATSTSMIQTIEKLYPRYSAGLIPTIQKYIKLWNLTTSHWTGQSWAKGAKLSPRTTDDKLFVLGSTAKRSTVKSAFMRRVVCVCSVCGISDWLGQKLTLQLDHINGIRNDDRFENLRLLCPNCHSQTETFAGKNKVSIVGLEPTNPRF